MGRTSPGTPAGGDGRRDRYGSLMQSLRAAEGTSGAVPAGDAERRTPSRRRIGSGWHPVARWLVAGVAIAVLAYVALLVGSRLTRESAVDVWSGPDASVRSGQRLAGCPEVEDLGDGTYPSWVRWGDAVYRYTDALRPIGVRTGPGETGFTETGYSLGRLRLLLVDDTERGRAREYVLMVQPPATAGHIYERTACT